jgi:hypothetical protein
VTRRLLSTDEILSIVATTPERLRDLTVGATPTQLRVAPARGEWSVTEILAHLRSCTDVWGDAIELLLSRPHPTIRAVNPRTWIEGTDYRTLSFATSFASFRRQRRRLVARLTNLPADDWDRSGTVLGGGAPIERTVHTFADRLARHERGHWRQLAATVRSTSS